VESWGGRASFKTGGPAGAAPRAPCRKCPGRGRPVSKTWRRHHWQQQPNQANTAARQQHSAVGCRPQAALQYLSKSYSNSQKSGALWIQRQRCQLLLRNGAQSGKGAVGQQGGLAKPLAPDGSAGIAGMAPRLFVTLQSPMRHTSAAWPLAAFFPSMKSPRVGRHQGRAALSCQLCGGNTDQVLISLRDTERA